MALRFLLDENQRGVLWNVIQRHNVRGIDPLDAVRVGDPSDLPLGAEDPAVLRWAEREQRILITSDKSSMSGHSKTIWTRAAIVPAYSWCRWRPNQSTYWRP